MPRRVRNPAHDIAAGADVNARVAAFLYDLAYAQTSQQSRFGYKRAAATILNLDAPIDTLVDAGGTLSRIFGIGPSSTRVILEVLQTGASATVERAVAASDKQGDIARRRALRDRFLSRARVKAVLAAPHDLQLSSCRGDLQMHSTWSDGSQPVAELIEGCLARGYEYCAITDHSHGLPIARGMAPASVGRQHQEIDRLNRRYAGRFRVIKGIEANILADGRLDVTADEVRALELVIAAPHSKLRTAEFQTTRLVAAIRVPGVRILAHPRGRVYGSREGVRADWDAVFEAAANADVAVELDGDPARQDLDYDLARRAVDAGCLIALDSDAHGVAGLAAAETAWAHARLADIPCDRIINTWPVDRLLEWCKGQRAKGKVVGGI